MKKEPLKQRRLRIKKTLIAPLGGKCKVCGYNKSLSALCFHHRNPQEKEFNISGVNLTKKKITILKEEVKKCDIYCLNCHVELHDKEGWVHENGKRTQK